MNIPRSDPDSNTYGPPHYHRAVELTEDGGADGRISCSQVILTHGSVIRYMSQ